MNAFDKHPHAPLAAEETHRLGPIDEPPLIEQIITSFRGRSRWLVTLAFVIIIAWMVFAVVAAFQFARTDDLHEMIAWAGAVGLSIIVVGLTKVWYWMELNKHVVTSEIKRVELQIARLSERLAKTT